MAKKKAAAPAATRKVDFLAALVAAGQEDLEAVSREIENHERALEGLKAARKILTARLNGIGCRDAPRAKLSDEEREKRLNAIYDYLAETKRGPATPKEIGEATGLESIAVGRLCARSDWFEKDGMCWKIARRLADAIK